MPIKNLYLNYSPSGQIFLELQGDGPRAVEDDAWVEKVEHDPQAEGEPPGEVKPGFDGDIEAVCFLGQKLNSFQFISKTARRGCQKQKY